MRLRAAEACWDVDRNGPEVLPVLIEGVRNLALRQRALWIMARLGPAAKDALPALMPLLQAGSLPNVLNDAFRDIGPDAVPPLMEMFTRKGMAGGQAENMLESMGSDAAPSLLKLLDDPDLRVRSSVLMTLGQVASSGPEIVPALMEAAQKGDANLRLTAMTALGIAGPEARAAAPALSVAVKDRSSVVRSPAAEALRKVDPEAAAAAGVP
jgi:HEAT repeat protein